MKSDEVCEERGPWEKFRSVGDKTGLAECRNNMGAGLLAFAGERRSELTGVEIGALLDLNMRGSEARAQ